jgi:hypothetical protein
MPCADSSIVCVRRQVTTNPVPPGDPQQALAFVITDLTNL